MGNEDTAGQLVVRAATPSQLGEEFVELIERFLLSQDIKPTSKQAYCRALRPFFRWLTREGIRSPDREDISDYTRPKASASIWLRHAAVHTATTLHPRPQWRRF